MGTPFGGTGTGLGGGATPGARPDGAAYYGGATPARQVTDWGPPAAPPAHDTGGW